VFAYLVRSFGESLDGMRFPTADSDMPELARMFRSFISVKSRFADDPDAGKHLTSPKMKLIPPSEILESHSWAVDRFWPTEERAALGLYEELTTVSEDEFLEALEAIPEQLGELVRDLRRDQ
jgi:hypothetical protein